MAQTITLAYQVLAYQVLACQALARQVIEGMLVGSDRVQAQVVVCIANTDQAPLQRRLAPMRLTG